MSEHDHIVEYCHLIRRALDYGAYSHALQKSSLALVVAERLGDVELQAQLLDYRSHAAIGLGLYLQAITDADAAIQQARVLHHPLLVAAAQTHKGIAQSMLGRIDEATVLFEDALHTFKVHGKINEEIAVHLALGEAALYAGELHVGAFHLELARSQAEVQGDTRHYILALVNLMFLDLRLDKWIEARERAETLIITRLEARSPNAGPPRHHDCLALTAAAGVFALLGDRERAQSAREQLWKRALDVFIRSEQIASRIGDRTEQVMAQINQATLYTRLEMPHKALALLNHSTLPLARQNNNQRAIAYCLINIADVHIQTLFPDHQHREEPYQRISTRQLSSARHQNHDASHLCWHRSLPRRHPRPCRRLIRYPWRSTHLTLRKQALHKVGRIYRYVCRLMQALGDDGGLQLARFRLADVSAYDGLHTRRAITDYRIAISILERIRGLLAGEEYRLGFFSTGIDYYDGIVAFYCREGRFSSAFEAVERARGRTLIDALAAHPLPAVGGDPELIEQEQLLFREWMRRQQALQRQAGQERREIQREADQLKTAHAMVLAQFPPHIQALREGRTTTIAEIRASLRWIR